MGFFTGLFIGLIVAWVFLPEPVFVRDFFVRLGWAKPASPPAPEA